MVVRSKACGNVSGDQIQNLNVLMVVRSTCKSNHGGGNVTMLVRSKACGNVSLVVRSKACGNVSMWSDRKRVQT